MAFDTFLDIKDAPGESTAKGFEKKIEIYSFSWGASNPSTIGSGAGGSGGGKVSISSFNVMKKTESSSPILFQACCRGDHFDKAIVTMRKAGGAAGQVPFLLYTFTEVYVDSIQWSGSTGGDDTPTESASFSFGKVEVEYKPQGVKGGAEPKPILATWDLTTVSA
jgi:type VI secretion system secreted protein Hcp